MTINYRDTLNLPVTDFSMKAGLPKKEPEILNMWSDKNIYNKIRKKYEDKDLFLPVSYTHLTLPTNREV